jgi:hypothetical protein
MTTVPEDTEATAFASAPEPEFEVVGVSPVERAVAPTLRFDCRITTATPRPVYAVALTALFSVEPGKRGYEAEERERLAELFGAPERWASTTGAFRWAQVDVMVPGFTGAGEFGLPVACSYDLELASGQYFGSLADGTAPLRIHFNGSVFYEDEGGAVQVVPIPWDRSVRFELPLSTWKRMIEAHHPNRGWIPLATDTVERLRARRARAGAPTFDACVSDLLDRAGDEAGGA